MTDNDSAVLRLPTDSECINFQGWKICYNKSHILKSVCTRGDNICPKNDPECCDLCLYMYSLELPHLPDMVFHKNKLSLVHADGAKIEFTPLEALKLVENGKRGIQVACAQEWKETRPDQLLGEKFKPFDWTFVTNYQGSFNNKIRLEETDEKLNLSKLMKREEILFYHDLTLFEDELHDNGIASCSVKIRVMPSGFFILLRYFLRVDNVLLKMNDTRYHYEIENKFILKEYTSREASVDELKDVPPPYLTMPNEVEKYLPIKIKQSHKLYFD